MKSYFKLLVTLFVLSTLLSCKSTKSTDGSPQYQLIDNDEFSFKLLDTWFEYQNSTQQTYYAPKKNRGRKDLVHINYFQVDSEPYTVSIEDIISHRVGINYMKKELRQNGIDIKTTDSKYGKAYIAERTKQTHQSDFKILTYYYNFNGKVSFLEFEAAPKLYDKYINDVKFMFNSLVIKDHIQNKLSSITNNLVHNLLLFSNL